MNKTNVPAEKMYKVGERVLNTVLQYLSTKPFNEVNDLIILVQQSAIEIAPVSDVPDTEQLK